MREPLPVTLAQVAERTESGEGAAVDGEVPGRSAGLLLDVTAGTGGELTAKVETSETGLGDWTEAHAFKALSGPAKLAGSFGGLKRYVRAAWEISGGTFTFSVTGNLYAHIVTLKQLEDHVGAITVNRLLDDANPGVVNALLAYASSMLRGKIGDVSDLSIFSPESQSEIMRIGLDICVARAALRHPEVMRVDGMKLMEAARADLREIRLTSAGLGKRDAPAPDTDSHAAVVSSPRRDWR